MPSGSAPDQLPPPSTTSDEARRAAEEILRRPEFQPPPRSLYQRALDKVGELLGKVIDAIVSGGAGSLLAWALIVAAVGALTYLVVRGIQSDRRRRAAREAPPAVDVDLDLRRAPSAWDADAARHEAAGHWREALRCRYRSLLSTLVRAGVLSDAPGRTSGEHRSVVRSIRPTLDQPFSTATELFERAWYGDEPTGPDESAEFRRVAERVKAGVS